MSSSKKQYRSIDTPFEEDESLDIYGEDGEFEYIFKINQRQYRTLLPVEPKDKIEWVLTFQTIMDYFSENLFAIDAAVEIADHKFSCRPFSVDETLPAIYVFDDNEGPAIRWSDGSVENWKNGSPINHKHGRT